MKFDLLIFERAKLERCSGSRCLPALLLVIWIISLAAVFLNITSNLIYIPLCLVLFFMFSAWGHLLIFPLYYKKGRLLEGIIWGTVAGLPLGALITSIIIYCVGWNLFVIGLLVIGLPGIGFFILMRMNNSSGAPKPVGSNDVAILLAGLIIVTCFFYFPFKNLGALVEGKYLYTWLFGHDFINRMVHVISLSRGLPLESYFFAGETLSYYWLAYVFPAFLLNVQFIKLDTQQTLQLTVFLYSLLATGALYLFLKTIANRRKYVLMLMFLALCCYSYSYIYIIFIKIWSLLTGHTILRIFNFDLPVFSGFSHTFYRFFLVQPQAVLGMAIMLMILSLYGKKQTFYEFSLIGLLTGLLFGVDATNGIMLGGWLGFMTIFAVLHQREGWLIVAQKHILSLLCAGLMYASFFAIDMYSLHTGKGVLQLKLNWFTLLTSPFYFVLEYGPMLLFGVAGLIQLFREREELDHWVYPYFVLFGIALFFNFFITNPTEVFFGLLKATRVIPICLLAFTAFLWRRGFQNKKRKVVTFLMLSLAFPSYFMDNFIASDLNNPSTYVRRSDMQAAIWIKNNLPEKAIIQAEPNYPGKDGQYSPQYSYSLIPIFAERRTAIGAWKVSSQEHSGAGMVGERFHAIKKMFATTHVDECINILEKYNIDYIYVGRLEKRLYPNGIEKFYSNRDWFRKIYHGDNTEIYQLISLKK